MNSSIFEEVFHYMNNHFRVQNKKILLLVDNTLSHFDPHYNSLNIVAEQGNISILNNFFYYIQLFFKRSLSKL